VAARSRYQVLTKFSTWWRMAALPEPSLPFKWSLDSAIGDPCHPRVVQSAESSAHPVRSWWSRRRRWRRGDDGDDGEVVFLGESV
jgi:hypothetical protein